MKIRQLFRKAVKENFIIVAISTGLTMNEYHNPIVVNLIEDCCPDYWELLTPSAYLVFFRSKHSASRNQAEKLIEGIRNLILHDEKFEYFKVGINEGVVLTELDWRGRVTFPPVGEAVLKATKNEKGKQDFAQQNFQADQ
ncbi:MAG: hypothetical protein HY957_02280 [Nitrospirae bacterium]|nr:hypothetical protein [Nitrospirota bacterium]